MIKQWKKLSGALGLAFFAALIPAQSQAQDGNNACPVDGCIVKISSVKVTDGELDMVFEANFVPSMSKNHLHVWWGEQYDIKQVTANAESTYKMTQGVWHPTDEYPNYKTRGVISTAERGSAVTICVTASDRNHEVIDPEVMDCKNVADLF